MIIAAIPISELQLLVRAFRRTAEKCAGRAISVMHDTGDDLTATAFVSHADALFECAGILESFIAEWTITDTLPDADTAPEVQL